MALFKTRTSLIKNDSRRRQTISAVAGVTAFAKSHKATAYSSTAAASPRKTKKPTTSVTVVTNTAEDTAGS